VLLDSPRTSAESRRVRCASCNSELVEGKRFCHACGAAVSRRCGSCGAEVGAQFRFCTDCGKALAADGLTVSSPDILIFDEKPRPECNDKLHFTSFGQAPVHSTEPAQDQVGRCFGGHDVELGLSVLKKLHLYVSSKEKLLYITGAGAK